MRHTGKRTAVVVDRHPILLDAVRRLLHRTKIQVVGVSTSIDDIVHLAAEHQPDLLFVDAELGGEGLAAIDCVHAARVRVPRLSVVVFVPEGRADLLAAALDAGAVVVLKSAYPEDLLAALRQIVSRSIYTANPP